MFRLVRGLLNVPLINQSLLILYRLYHTVFLKYLIFGRVSCILGRVFLCFRQYRLIGRDLLLYTYRFQMSLFSKFGVFLKYLLLSFLRGYSIVLLCLYSPRFESQLF
uniref:Uncharacterized protein n=1 Tax=Methanococcus maripaludis (strain C5 / ATCC BAA-1333) TaxID=402880 RepID=O06101_METM5|nr:unknown [Methanococcus maripaludis C5]